jgi:hypothetical protein
MGGMSQLNKGTINQPGVLPFPPPSLPLLSPFPSFLFVTLPPLHIRSLPFFIFLHRHDFFALLNMTCPLGGGG